VDAEQNVLLCRSKDTNFTFFSLDVLV